MTSPMQPVPDNGAYEAEDVSDHGLITMSATAAIGSNGLDELHRLDHVRPEKEIENRLRPAD
jgi:hypothetical protein